MAKVKAKPRAKKTPPQRSLEERELRAIAEEMGKAPKLRLAPSMNKYAQVLSTDMDRWIEVLNEMARRLGE